MTVTADCLDPLIGLRLTVTSLAADMRIFGFGPLQDKPIRFGPHKGQTGVVGSHSLHLQCPWRLRHDGITLTGSSDLHIFDGSDQPADWHYEHGNSRQSCRCGALAAAAPLVLAVAVDIVPGDILITLEAGYRIEVFPDTSFGEAWRFLVTAGDVGHVVFEKDEDG